MWSSRPSIFLSFETSCTSSSFVIKVFVLNASKWYLLHENLVLKYHFLFFIIVWSKTCNKFQQVYNLLFHLLEFRSAIWWYKMISIKFKLLIVECTTCIYYPQGAPSFSFLLLIFYQCLASILQIIPCPSRFCFNFHILYHLEICWVDSVKADVSMFFSHTCLRSNTEQLVWL